jgi:uncharacterized membrane protein HdeD (DUF308 family)
MDDLNPYRAPESAEPPRNHGRRHSSSIGGLIAVYCGVFLLSLPAAMLVLLPRPITIGLILLSGGLIRYLSPERHVVRIILTVWTGVASLFAFVSTFLLIGSGAQVLACLIATAVGLGYLFAAVALAKSEYLTDFLDAMAERRLARQRAKGIAKLRQMMK